MTDASAERICRVERIAWYICVATLGTWAVAYITWPFSNDQGNLAWVGSVVVSGGMPYRDAWDVKGPAAHVLFALAQLAFGRHEWGLRLFDLLALAAGMLAIRRITAAYAGRGAVRWAIALDLLWYASLDHHNTAQPDGWCAVMLTVAVALLVTRPRLSLVSGALTGALVGVCALVKPTYVLFLALPLVAGLTRWRSGGGPRVLRFCFAAALGFAVPVGLCIGWFVARGAIDDWITVHLRWIPSSYTQVDAAWLNRVQALVAFMTSEQFAPTVPLVVGGLVLVRRQSWPDAAVLATWVGVAALGVLVQGQFYTYHWLPLYPAFAVLGGLGFDALWRWLRRRASATHAPSGGKHNESGSPAVELAVGAAVAAVVLAGAALEPALHDYRFGKSLVSAAGASDYDRVEFGPFGHRGGVFPEIVGYVRARSSPEDRVLVWGSNAGINYQSDRGAVTPFGFIQPLVDPPDTDIRREYRDRFVAELTHEPPRYVIALNASACARKPSPSERQLMGRAEGLIRCLSDLPALETFVRERYVMERTFGPLEAWRLR